jgi:hypothetical protein
MANVRILYADPNVVRRDLPGSTWLISGLVTGSEATFQPGASDDGRAEAALCRRVGDATVVRVDSSDGSPTRVRIWRGGASSYEAHYAIRPGGDVIVADHFRNIVCLVPVAERQPSDAVAIDHFLVRHARGRDTYSRAVRRAGHGELVEIDIRTGHVGVGIFDRLVSRLDPRPHEQYIAELDRALAQEMDALRGVPGAVMMLSGGMDSTLMQSYVKHDVPALHVQADSDDFHLGGQYLDAAAAALGIEPERVVVPTDELLQQLEEAIDGRALPPHFPQWVTLGRVYTRPHDVFIIGERAGAYSRFGGRIPYTARPFSRFPGSLLQPALHAAAALGRPYRMKLLADQAPALGEDPRSPHGWGAQMPQSYGDRAWAERVFGYESVLARYEERLAYVEQRIELLPSNADRYFRHLEIARWLEFYNENNSQFRSLAFAYGKAMVDPFTARSVIDAVLAVPATERYQDGAHSKYIVERLLRDRVPAYPVTAGKDDIVVPFRRYYSSGPLAQVWDRYDVPALFTGADRTRLVEHPIDTDWNAVTWAIWQDRIANNEGLGPLPTALDLSWRTSSHDVVTASPRPSAG